MTHGPLEPLWLRITELTKERDELARQLGAATREPQQLRLFMLDMRLEKAQKAVSLLRSATLSLMVRLALWHDKEDFAPDEDLNAIREATAAIRNTSDVGVTNGPPNPPSS